MDPIFFIILPIAVFLMLFSFLRIAESAFIRITSEFLDDIDHPTLSDYRTDQFLNKPAQVMIAFSLLKYIQIIAITIGLYIGCDYLIPSVSFAGRAGVTLGSVVLLLWIFGELIPSLVRRVDERKAFQSSFFIIVPVSGLVSMLRLSLPFSFARHENRLSRKESISMSDISDAIENSEVEDEEIMEKQLIKGVLNFGDLEVKEIMRARMDVVSIRHEAPFAEVMDKVLEAGYSRYPVYGTSLDDIKGIVYLKDLLPAIRLGQNNFAWQNHLRQAVFVPENMKISQLLVDFQARNMHMAVVVDEYGGTSGVVSLEDILEEIVGEINDEHDSDSDQILARKTGENMYVFDAKIPIHDLIRMTGIENNFFDEFEGEVETLGGIILSIHGNFPVKNQTISYHNIDFTVLSMNKYRIGTVKVKINESNQDS